MLRGITGAAPVVVLHTEARAHSKLDAFRAAREPWIVAVNMVSEGVDIPRLRVGVYATVAKTPLIFRQIVGRFVRTIPGRPVEPSWLYLPADPVLRRHAADVESELRHVLRRRRRGRPARFDELRGARRDRARGGRRRSCPLAADVAPQIALFGGARRGGGRGGARAGAAARGARRARRPRSSAARSCATSATGSWATCAAATAARTPRSTRWLNRACGVRRVEDATIEQLERSIELLLVELSRR